MRLIRLLEASKPAATQIAVDCRISDETIVDAECAPERRRHARPQRAPERDLDRVWSDGVVAQQAESGRADGSCGHQCCVRRVPSAGAYAAELARWAPDR